MDFDEVIVDNEFGTADDEPTEDDLVTEDHSHFYQYRRLVLTVDPDATRREMWKALDAYMERQQFWPNVWFVSDHGNAHLMTR